MRRNLVKVLSAAFACVLGAFSSIAAARIDILAAYDTRASAWLAAEGITPEAFAASQVAKANEVLANTGLGGQCSFRLVGVYEGAFTHPAMGDLASTLYSAMGSASAEWAALRGERERVGADIVAVFVDTGYSAGTMGISSGMLDATVEGVSVWSVGGQWLAQYMEYFSERAYSICDIQNASSSYIFVHEVGHVLGAGHSEVLSPLLDEPGPQLFSFSKAVMARAHNGAYYATVMGYSIDGTPGSPTYTVLPCFSSPYLMTSGGDSLGDAAHDNARTVAMTFPYVAAFRSEVAGIEAIDTAGGAAAAGPGEFSAKTELTAKVVDGGEVVGIAQFTVAATRGGYSRVTGSVTGLDGKKHTVKAGKWEVHSSDGVSMVALRNVPVKGYDAPLSIVLRSDGKVSAGSIGSLSLLTATLGGFSAPESLFSLAAPFEAHLGEEEVVQSVEVDGVMHSVVPYGEGAQVLATTGKWKVGKAGRLRLVKDRTTGEKVLVAVPGAPGDANLSALRLTFTQKTGTFKGSFAVYTLADGRLKKYTFNVSGVAVDGEGIGRAVCKKAGLTMPVSVK